MEPSSRLEIDLTSNRYAPLASLSSSPQAQNLSNESCGIPQCENKGDPLQNFISILPHNNCKTLRDEESQFDNSSKQQKESDCLLPQPIAHPPNIAAVSHDTSSHPLADATTLNNGWVTVQSKCQKQQQKQTVKTTGCRVSTKQALNRRTKKRRSIRQQPRHKPMLPFKNQKNPVQKKMKARLTPKIPIHLLVPPAPYEHIRQPRHGRQKKSIQYYSSSRCYLPKPPRLNKNKKSQVSYIPHFDAADPFANFLWRVHAKEIEEEKKWLELIQQIDNNHKEPDDQAGGNHGVPSASPSGEAAVRHQHHE